LTLWYDIINNNSLEYYKNLWASDAEYISEIIEISRGKKTKTTIFSNSPSDVGINNFIKTASEILESIETLKGKDEYL